jgi:hypothetical protein
MEVDQMVDLDIVLPSQLFGRRRSPAPELRLMIAVFRDALDCLEKHSAEDSAQNRRLYFEAREWFLADEANWPYSFEGICGVLDLDSNAVRRQLGMASPDDTVKSSTTAPSQPPGPAAAGCSPHPPGRDRGAVDRDRESSPAPAR